MPDTPPEEDFEGFPRISTPQQRSWGALIALVVILAMITLGAFYAWNKRASEPLSGGSSLPSATTTP